MNKHDIPQLFGLNNSNRDFSRKESWGKNNFNSSFPASLCCYMAARNLKANYLKVENRKFNHGKISIEEAFGIASDPEDVFFAFESVYMPFQTFIINSLPRTDLVIQKSSNGKCLASMEIKLTALPDNTTCDLNQENYGSEIVVRPDTIVYLACSIVQSLKNHLNELMKNAVMVYDWSEPKEILPSIPLIIDTLKSISVSLENYQLPFLLQPIWKTNGKSPQLSEYCLDAFFWSNAGFLYFVTEIANPNAQANKITRQTRTAIWLYKMLLDVAQHGKFDHENIIDSLSYNTKNDKAFASSGNITNKFMSCDRLIKPAIKKNEIKNIILGGGQNLLSPERRFDAIIYNSPELFSR